MENVFALFFVGLPVFIIISTITLVLLGVVFSIWMFIDCLNRDEIEFKDKTLWTILLAVGFFAGYNILLSIVYYFVVKKKLDN